MEVDEEKDEAELFLQEQESDIRAWFENEWGHKFFNAGFQCGGKTLKGRLEEHLMQQGRKNMLSVCYCLYENIVYCLLM